MKIIISNIKFLIYFFLVSLAIFYLIKISYDQEIWLSFWRNINVPSMWPANADIDHIYRSLLCKKMGIDPFIFNPCEISGTRYQYPASWLLIFDLLKINNLYNLKIFLSISLSLFLFSYLYLFEITNNKFNKIILLFLFLSPSSLLLIERGNIDHIVFTICILSVISKNYYLEIFLILFNSYLKVYPIFNFISLIKNKRIVFTLVIFFLTVFLIYQFSVSKYINPNHSFLAATQSYGILSVVEGFFKILVKKYNYEVSYDNKIIIRFLFIIIFILVAFLFFFIGSKTKKVKIQNNKNYNKLFLYGSSIYVGSYIFFSNFDYRLVFLYMTIPYIGTFCKRFNILYSIFLLIISNSWLANFPPLTLEHVILTSVIYLIKLFFFVFLSYEMGKMNNNFFDIILINLKKNLQNKFF